jgi:hypothetical protein
MGRRAQHGDTEARRRKEEKEELDDSSHEPVDDYGDVKIDQ